MPIRSSLGRQAVRRLVLALLLSGTLTAAVGTWVYLTTNAQAADSQMASAREHYLNVIANLERRWGLEAFSFKTRLETMRFLEDPARRQEKLIEYLAALGGSPEFTSLRLEDQKGQLITSFEYRDNSTPKARFLTGQESAWAMDPVDGRLFLVFRQMIWLGSENGYLLLFKPMDHALLTEYSFPRTRLSLWWQDKPVASSEGEDGLSAAIAARGKPDNNQARSLLPWSSTESENAPLLFIESNSGPLLTVGQFAAPLVASFITIALAVWAIFSRWGMDTIRRVRAIERAQSRFLVLGNIDETVRHELDAGHSSERDEIAGLTAKLEQIMQKASMLEHSESATMETQNSSSANPTTDPAPPALKPPI